MSCYHIQYPTTCRDAYESRHHLPPGQYAPTADKHEIASSLFLFFDRDREINIFPLSYQACSFMNTRYSLLLCMPTLNDACYFTRKIDLIHVKNKALRQREKKKEF